jgi:hypothetical protein
MTAPYSVPRYLLETVVEMAAVSQPRTDNLLSQCAVINFAHLRTTPAIVYFPKGYVTQQAASFRFAY